MADASLPTQQQLAVLQARVERDPASADAQTLALTLLAIGRPAEATAVLADLLAAQPEHPTARMVMARTLHQQHMWKECQAELLRIVKVDRSNRDAFVMLGEVLMRRNDYERAVPVLAHAQNLDPTSPQVLNLLKCARGGAPLEPPAALPIPVALPDGNAVPGAGARPGDSKAPPVPSAMRPGESKAPPIAGARATAPPPLRTPEHASAPPSERSARHSAPPAAQAPGAPVPAVLAGGQPSASYDPQAVPAARAVALAGPAVPPGGRSDVRPRIIGEKHKNPAQAALRQSAAVGENPIQDLLNGGLFAVAGLALPQATYDLRPDRRWGRTKRKLVSIGVATTLVFGLGTGGWWVWRQQQASAAVARLRREALVLARHGDLEGITAASAALARSMATDRKNPATLAFVAQIAGTRALLYGEDVAAALDAAKQARTRLKAGAEWLSAVVIGETAAALATLSQQASPATALANVERALDEALAAPATPPDAQRWMRWLKARLQLAHGQRKAARATLLQAADGADGLVVAMTDLGDLAVDDGNLTEGLNWYDKATAVSPDHPLAIAGRALARAEANADAAAALDDINVKLDKALGPRVTAYRELATAFAQLGVADYPRAFAAMAKVQEVAEPRFLARLAWLHLWRGNLAAANKVRREIVWYGATKPEADPLATVLDAGLAVAAGTPEVALELVGKSPSVRARSVQLWALLDTGKFKAAEEQADAVLKVAADDTEVQVLREWAATLAAAGSDAAAALERLEKRARKSSTKLGRFAWGAAMYELSRQNGNPELHADARRQLLQALDAISDENPHPVAYRNHVVLAELLLDDGDAAQASKQLELAAASNPGYVPIVGARARLLVRTGDSAGAVALLEPIMKQRNGLTPRMELTFAEALVTRKGAKPPDRQRATEIVTRLRTTFTPATDVGRVASLIDPKLPLQLALPVPTATPDGAGNAAGAEGASPSSKPVSLPPPVPSKGKAKAPKRR